MENTLYTVADLERVEGDYELDEGVLVLMNPPQAPHARVVGRISTKLNVYVSHAGLGCVYVGDAGFVLHRNPDTLRGVDVAFVRRERLSEDPDPVEGYLEGGPDLAVEVVSPGNRAGEILRKVSQYLAAGSQLVWVIYPRERRVVVYQGEDVQVLGENDLLSGGDVVPGFSCTVASLFSNDPL